MNKSSVLLILVFLMPLLSNAQIRAVTEKGDSIYVYSDGTWSFELEDIREDVMADFLEEVLDIDTITQVQSYPKSVDKTLETGINQFEFKYNSKQWKRVPPAEFNDDAEFAFELRNHDVMAIIITEETEIGTENILKIARSSLEENLGGTVEVMKIEQRNVNGTELLRGVFLAEVSGIEFLFDSYYYSDERGTTQLTVWTGLSLWEKYESKIVDFLNGMIVKSE